MWLDRVKIVYGDDLDVTWKNFQLEQANNKEGPGWKIWEQTDHCQGKSLVAAMAGEVVRRQGKETFDKFHLALLNARHGGSGRIPLNESGPIGKVAEGIGLDVGAFQEALKDRSLLEIIARDHMQAAENYGIFGTPTFVFENGSSAYLKTFIPPLEESVAFFDGFVDMMARRPYVGELKRPQPPWPKGVVR